MLVRELLKDFSGKDEVDIYDRLEYKTSKYRNSEQAILNYGHFPVKSWSVENGIVIIQVQSQF